MSYFLYLKQKGFESYKEKNMILNFFCSYLMQNVLHWHIVDEQAFPLEIPSFPKLWNGAYSRPERYTVAAATDIVRRVKYSLVYMNLSIYFSNMHFFCYVFVVMLKEGELMCLRSLTFLDMLDPGNPYIQHTLILFYVHQGFIMIIIQCRVL